MKKNIVLFFLAAIVIMLDFSIVDASGTCASTVVKNDKEFCMRASSMIAEAKFKSEASGAEHFSNRLLLISNGGLLKLSFKGLVGSVANGSDLYVLQFDTTENAQKAFKELKNDQRVESVEYDRIVKAENNTVSKVNNDKIEGKGSHYSWGAEKMGFDEYSEYINTIDHDHITVAVVDSGIDSTHKIFGSRLTGGYDFVNDDNQPEDEQGHGTHVSGIIADCTKNVAAVKLMPVKVLDKNGEGYVSTIADGMLYSASNGAKVINASMSGFHSSYIDRVVELCEKKGATVVAAAGNESVVINGRTTCPAHIESVITVGAVDHFMNRERYSNYGETLDVVAPGGMITSAAFNNTFNIASGTSMATPHVSAAISLMKYRYGNLSGAQVNSLITRSCKKLGKRIYYGNGIIDFRNLMTDISTQTISLPKKDYVYSGDNIRPRVSVTRNNQRLYGNIDYTVSYSKNINVGTAECKVKGKGSYSGIEIKHFTIIPRGTAIKKMVSYKSGISVSWKKQKIQTSGYQIKYSRKSDMTGSKTITISGTSKSSYRIKGLKPKKKYYFQVRTYKNADKTKYYSRWSSKKSAKVN